MSQLQDEKLPEATVTLLEQESSTPTSTLHQYANIAYKFWILEVVCVAVAVGAMAGIIGMLSHLDNSPLDSWTLKIGPNTVLSVLTNICRALVVTVIATCIAQLRWPYFASAPQRLTEFDTFDGATRGPWGALKFLFTIPFTKGTLAIIASFGAMLMILAIAIDPFAQQMLKFETDSVPTTGGPIPAMMPVSNGIAKGKTLLGKRQAWQAIYGGFLGFDYSMPYQCHTGNCTWPNFVSLGLCSSCQDAKPLLSFQCASGSTDNGTDCSTITSALNGTDISLTLKNGSQPLQTDGDAVKAYSFVRSAVGSNYPGGYGNSTLFQFVVAQLLVDLSAPIPQSFQPGWNLTFCSAKWCARVYENVTVANGMLMQPEARTFDLYEDTTSSCAGSNTCQQFVTRDPLGIPGTLNATYRIDMTQDAADVGQLFNFDNDLNAHSNGTWDVGTAFSVTSALFWDVNMTSATSKSASTFSDYLRANHVFSANIPGVTLVRTTFIRVRWAWIGLPAALVFLSIVLLAAVVFQAVSGPTSGRFFWKSSTLPLLFDPKHGNIQERQRQQLPESLPALAARANTLRGQLIDNGNGGVTFAMRDR